MKKLTQAIRDYFRLGAIIGALPNNITNGQALGYVHFERELGDAQPRNGSPATRVLTYNAFVR